MAPSPSSCPDCGAPVWWARSSYGNLAPYDAEPLSLGTWVLTYRASAGELEAEYHTRERELEFYGRKRYRTHLATCAPTPDPQLEEEPHAGAEQAPALARPEERPESGA